MPRSPGDTPVTPLPVNMPSDQVRTATGFGLPTVRNAIAPEPATGRAPTQRFPALRAEENPHMHVVRSTSIRRARRRLSLGVTGLATAALLAQPTVAHANWPVAGADAANSRQASTDLPTDPGLRWQTDLTQVSTDAAPDGYTRDGGLGYLDPLVGPDDLVLALANNPASFGRPALVGLNGATGEVELEIQGLQSSCAPAVDSSGRIWVALRTDADPDTTTPVIRAFDATGAAIADTDIPDVNLWCGANRAIQVGGDGAAERVVLFGTQGAAPGVRGYDITTTPPTRAFELDADDGYDALLGTGDSASEGAFTDDRLLLPVRVGTGAQLLFVALSDGSIDRRVTLPVLNRDGEDRDIADATVTVAVADDEAVAGIASRGDFTPLLHGVALAGNSTSVAWSQALPPAGGRNQASGPGLLGISGSTVVAPSGGVLAGYDRSTNQLTSWSGQPPAVTATRGQTNLIVDAQGRMATVYQPTAGAFSIVVYGANGSPLWEVNRNALLADTDGNTSTLKVASVTSDGAMLIRIGSLLSAIDNSGGLADCVVPFDDVAITNVHRENVCRLVQLEITGGVSATEYAPGRSVTRAQMASFLARSLGLSESSNARFPDVPANNVHAGNINAIADADITLGRGDGTYDPNGTVTRAEMASFLARAAGLEGITGTTFTDVDPSNVHTPNIYAVLEAGITTGRTATIYAPGDEVRRDQMASFLIRMVDLLEAQG